MHNGSHGSVFVWVSGSLVTACDPSFSLIHIISCCTQNGDRIVIIDSLMSVHPMHTQSWTWVGTWVHPYGLSWVVIVFLWYWRIPRHEINNVAMFSAIPCVNFLQEVLQRVRLLNAPAYRPIGRYRRSKQQMNDILKSSGRYTQLRQPILTLSLTLNPNFHHFCTNNAPFLTGNKHTANDVWSTHV